MQTLDAVNLILRAGGDQAVSAMSDQNASVAMNVLERERRRILGKGWPTNRDIVTLQVETDTGRVPVSRSFLMVRFDDDDMSVRDDPARKKRYVWRLSTSEYVTDNVRDVEVIFDIPDFPLIDDKLARWIAEEAALIHYSDKNPGRGNPVLEKRAAYAGAEVNLHLQANEKNVHEGTGWNAIRAASGGLTGAAVRVGSNWIWVG
jgi:hypothetical protein